MKTRVITAAVLLSVLALVVWQIYTPALVIVVAFLSAVASNEIMRCAKVSNKFILITGTVASAIIPFFSNPSCLEPVVSTEKWQSVIGAVPQTVYIIVICLAFFLAMLKGYSHTKFEDVTVSIVASILVPYVFSILVRLRDLQGYRSQFGIYLIFFALICALATDSGAQLAGMAFGKHKMSPNISPKKTVEGAVGGVVFSLILNFVAILLYNKFANAPISKDSIIVLMCFALPISILGMMGDLTASVLKRNFAVKDFGKIFPGHGGVMDRFDSSLFTLSATYALTLAFFS